MKKSSRIGFGMGDMGYIGIGEISRLHELVSVRKESTHAYQYIVIGLTLGTPSYY